MQERRLIDGDLETLRKQLTLMAQLAERRVEAAIDALVECDRAHLLDVIDGDKPLNDLQIEVDDRCFTLLALHQPVAVDLRFVVASTRCSADLERIGDLAVNIAEAGNRYLQHRPNRPLVDLPRMSTVARQMLIGAVNAFLEGDNARAQIALQQDRQLDAFNTEVFRELLTDMLRDARLIEPGIDLILIARHLARVGNHAANIAEEAMFIADIHSELDKVQPSTM